MKTSDIAQRLSHNLETLLGDNPARPWWQRPVSWLALALVLTAAIGAYFWLGRQSQRTEQLYITEAVRRGNLTLTVAANGTLQPTRSVNIGSELSGTVKQVLVDVNDRVKKGQVLVVLDTAKLSDQVQRSRAALAAAQAQLAQNTATVKEARANLARLEEVARLSGGKVPSATELDSARANVDRALASETSAHANVAEARAALSTDETNLGKASIRSPIDGMVLSRSVEPGNAVAASLQAVTLLTIAEDLHKLRLEVNVDEADVGAVKAGQKARFTVSSYPSRPYPAEITRVAYGSTKTDNVVTYVTYLDVSNDDLSLRPGMTAAATIVATERSNVLLVPNTALRFSPSTSNGASPAAATSGNLVSKLMPRPPSSGSRRVAGNPGQSNAAKQVWVLQEGRAVPLDVTTGISDGRMTEVQSSALQEGMAVITDQRAVGAAP
jgi:HlyD family secretion protein